MDGGGGVAGYEVQQQTVPRLWGGTAKGGRGGTQVLGLGGHPRLVS